MTDQPTTLVIDALTPNGRRETWIVINGVGGYVCAEDDKGRPDDICGMPVETEPCTIHHPDAADRDSNTYWCACHPETVEARS